MLVFETADDVFAMGVLVKEHGRQLDAGAATESEDPILTKLFEHLASLEGGHIALVRRLRGQNFDDFSEGRSI